MFGALNGRRARAAIAIAVALASISLLNGGGDPPAHAFPVATDQATYDVCGRVFPDPHAYWGAAPLPVQSPWAKGSAACRAVDFLGWDETIAGLRFLESMAPDFLEVYDLSDPNGPFAPALDLAGGEGMSAGLPTESLGRDRVPMYVVRVTDEASTRVPIPDRQRFAFTLSIHGIERAGVEGGVRAIEDLVTWAACEADASALSTCALNGPIPHPIMETIPDQSATAGDVLERSQLWFVLSNPDGWRRGDKQAGGFFYQRYNGNGMDLNRDWPALGYTFRPFTPWSEPETRTVGAVLQAINPRWQGGLDLHGQLIDRAFSFTLIGGAERPFDKDRRVLQFVRGAWADAETRLAWSPLIKPNSELPACVEPGVGVTVNDQPCDPTPRVYGVQWGTVWDTIAYTTTGAVGDWMDSPIGLGADGVDNEMSMSHLSNCGVGSCFLPEIEQLHVDGNKSLIYALVQYTLEPEDTGFRYGGVAGWLDHDVRISNPGHGPAPLPPGLPVQDGFETDLVVNPLAPATYEFDVLGPSDGVANGGFNVTATSANLTGVAPQALIVAVDRYRTGEEDPNAPEPGWSEVNSYYDQAPTYLQGGARVDVNAPTPGRYRIRVEGLVAGAVHLVATFTDTSSWPDPGQLPYDVSNLDFFTDLVPFANAGQLVPAPIDSVLAGAVDLSQLDSLVIADGAFLPGYAPPGPPVRTDPQAPIEGDVAMGVSGLGVRSPATSAFFEFDVEAGNGALQAHIDAPTAIDPDLYLQRQLPDGSYTDDLADGTSAQSFQEDLTLETPDAGHYRIEAHNYAGAPGDAHLTITFTVPEAAATATAAASAYDAADEQNLLARLRAFVEGGGNLVLTDDALVVLERLGLLPPGSVHLETVYAGFVEFSLDGGTTDTYADPLAANVDQPGAAEGPSNRHQTVEPVPIGYSIQDENGADLGTTPQWVIDPAAWGAAGGRAVGMANGGVTLGELPLGAGRIRIIGALLPQPTEAFDHPFGLGSYGVTYTGYEVFRDALDVAPRVAPAPTPAPAAAATPTLPATGPTGPGPWGPLTMAVAAVGAAWLSRRRAA